VALICPSLINIYPWAIIPNVSDNPYAVQKLPTSIPKLHDYVGKWERLIPASPQAKSNFKKSGERDRERKSKATTQINLASAPLS